MSGWDDEPVFAGRVALAVSLAAVTAGVLVVAGLLAAWAWIRGR